MDIGKYVKTVEVPIEAPVELPEEPEWPDEAAPVEEPEREPVPVAPRGSAPNGPVKLRLVAESAEPEPFPEPTDDAPVADYKARVHAWLRAVPVEGDYTEAFLRAEDEYICSLAGVDPD